MFLTIFFHSSSLAHFHYNHLCVLLTYRESLYCFVIILQNKAYAAFSFRFSFHACFTMLLYTPQFLLYINNTFDYYNPLCWILFYVFFFLLILLSLIWWLLLLEYMYLLPISARNVFPLFFTIHSRTHHSTSVYVCVGMRHILFHIVDGGDNSSNGCFCFLT